MFHVKHEGWDIAADIGIALDDPALVRLESYERLLLEVAIPRGMVARSDVPRLRDRHVMDSLRAVPFLPTSGRVCDLGSGAGLPGLVLAIVRPDLHFVLVEARRNRAEFLDRGRAAIGLQNVEVYGRRLQRYRDAVDVCTARAFGSPRASWAAAERLLVPAGFLIYWAGTSFEAARDGPERASLRVFETPALARSGPLVIMARQ